MKIEKLTLNELCEYYKIADISATKYFRESNINKKSQEIYLKNSAIIEKLLHEINKRLNELE